MGESMNNELTRAYLNQLKTIDKRIKYKLDEAEKWRNIAENHSSHISDIKVQSSPKPDKMADAIVKAIQYEEESYALADKLVVTKNELIREIDAMEEKHYIILNLAFMQNKTYREMGAELDCSYNNVKGVLRDAIKAFGDKYEDNITKFITESQKKAEN